MLTGGKTGGLICTDGYASTDPLSQRGRGVLAPQIKYLAHHFRDCFARTHCFPSSFFTDRRAEAGRFRAGPRAQRESGPMPFS